MATPHSLNHSLLRPCILHILRAAGYHSTKPTVLDTLTDLAARYMLLLAQSTMTHASVNGSEFDITITDVRQAMQDCGALLPERVFDEQLFDNEEDTRGVDTFLNWATGNENREIRRVALEGAETMKEDYLTVLKKKHSTVADDDSRYNNTVLGKSGEPRVVKIEGGEFESIKDWSDKRRAGWKHTSALSSRRQSSALSSLEDVDMEDMDF
ncbi:hypothetical protein B0O99DRAFT_528389 [Bisporella sp. PMI_857]|nr:hypothetical protein B0O99DRAFT_528389 [Bisporella sp. PMI_857]